MAEPRPSVPAEVSRAGEQMARGVLVAFVVAAFVAVLGPLISFRSDVAQTRAMLKERVAQLARVYAEAVGRHLEVMQAELVLISGRNEMDPGRVEQPEGRLKDFNHYHSALFETGLFLVDARGRTVWSAPPAIGSVRPDVGRDPWFQALLLHQRAVAEVLEKGSHLILVAAPVVRNGDFRGAVVGLFDAERSELPGTRAMGEGTTIVIMDPAGDLLTPNAPAFTRTRDFHREISELVHSEDGREMSFEGRPFLAAATEVEGNALWLALVADEEPLIEPMRRRFLLQLVVVASVQTAAVFILSLFMRQMLRRTLEAERKSVEAEKLAALGAAASLIAHEVKNSLNGLNAATSMLEPGSAEQSLPLRTLRGQVERLKHLASSLLHFGKPTEPRRVSIELAPLLTDTVEGLRVLPEADEVDVKVFAPAGTRVQCDPLLLATAVDNLVRNAIEAAVAAKDLGKNPEPKVTVALQSDASIARINVEDNAGGPPEGMTLFRPFTTSKSKGIGLGLLMARRAMEAQGGKLIFTRTPQGSRFTLELPNVAGDAAGG